jgi:hypothetical protein
VRRLEACNTENKPPTSGETPTHVLVIARIFGSLFSSVPEVRLRHIDAGKDVIREFPSYNPAPGWGEDKTARLE